MKLEEYLSEKTNSRNVFDMAVALNMQPLALIKACEDLGLRAVVLGELA